MNTVYDTTLNIYAFQSYFIVCYSVWFGGLSDLLKVNFNLLLSAERVGRNT